MRRWTFRETGREKGKKKQGYKTRWGIKQMKREENKGIGK